MTNDCNRWLERLLEEGAPASVLKEFKILYSELMLGIATNDSFTCWIKINGREEFKGKNCGQVFLHYNKASSKTAKENYLDKRPLLGVPAWFKGVKLTKPTK